MCSSTKARAHPTRSKQRKKTKNMDLYYRAVQQVGETWQTVKELPDYELLVGELLFRQIFEIAPAALHMYPFGCDKDISSDNKVPNCVFDSRAFKAHARNVVTMLETVIVMMLGDNMDKLATTLQELGSRHVGYGVHPAHYSIVETALLRVLASALSDQWTEEVRKGWAAVFKFISKAMMSGAGAELEIIKDRRRMLERNKSATLRLKVIGNSNGISRLSRSGVSTMSRRQHPQHAGSSRNSRRTRNGSPSHTRRNDPPRLPPRGGRRRANSCGDGGSSCSDGSSDGGGARIARRWSDLSPFREDEDMTISSSEGESSLARGYHQHRERSREKPEVMVPLNQPTPRVRRTGDSPLPDIIVFQSGGGDSLSGSCRSACDGCGSTRRSHSPDSAPKKPTRSREETDVDDFLVCKVEKRPRGDGMDGTVDSTSSTLEDDEYWREERIKVVAVSDTVSIYEV